MKKISAFTLVEVLISITILGIIFTFLFSTLNNTKKNNEPYIEKSKQITKESEIFKILVNDFTQIEGSPSVIYGKHFDIVRVQTKNSVHNIINPYVTYFVSKKENTLVRTESLTKYDLYKKTDIYKEFVYGDILAKDVTSFKIYFKDDFFNVLFRAKEMNPIVLKLALVK
jgi:prepilin-type N-terminal cleavage/methylation domain-containing protein